MPKEFTREAKAGLSEFLAATTARTAAKASPRASSAGWAFSGNGARDPSSPENLLWILHEGVPKSIALVRADRQDSDGADAPILLRGGADLLFVWYLSESNVPIPDFWSSPYAQGAQLHEFSGYGESTAFWRKRKDEPAAPLAWAVARTDASALRLSTGDTASSARIDPRAAVIFPSPADASDLRAGRVSEEALRRRMDRVLCDYGDWSHGEIFDVSAEAHRVRQDSERCVLVSEKVRHGYLGRARAREGMAEMIRLLAAHEPPILLRRHA